MADFSVPDGSKIGDLGINFREITNRLLSRYIEPVLPDIMAEYEAVRRRLADEIGSALSMLLRLHCPSSRQGGKRALYFRAGFQVLV